MKCRLGPWFLHFLLCIYLPWCTSHLLFLPLFKFFLFPLLPVLPIPPKYLSPSPPFIFTHLFFFRKGQASQKCQPDMAYQVAIRLDTSPQIKAGQGNAVGGKESQKQTKESERASTLTIRSPRRSPRWTTITYSEDLSQTHTGSLVVRSVSVSHCWVLICWLCGPCSYDILMQVNWFCGFFLWCPLPPWLL